MSIVDVDGCLYGPCSIRGMRDELTALKAELEELRGRALPVLPTTDYEPWRLTALYECDAGMNGGYCAMIAEAGCLPPEIKAYGKTAAEAVQNAINAINNGDLDGNV